MKLLTYFIICSVLTATSCAGINKGLKSKKEGETAKKTILMPATPIREVEEKLVPNNEEPPDPHKYFVIIGSFRDPANAKEHQAAISKDGFRSEILKNEAGLYRVSVMATDDISEARAEVRRIWAKFPAYSDTWMLISKTP
jgi:cell division protein FtsN